MKYSIILGKHRSEPGLPLLLLGLAAILAGLYARFKGIGTWPLGVDEFYLSRSVDHILSQGVPRFPCGGYYTRGLLYQYAVAALRLCGAPPELAGRSIAAACSIAVLPAGYLLACRLGGRVAGWATVVVLSLSIWEIEMARFARMYAPFQAVFAWYLLFFLRYTQDRQASALKWMVVLSITGVLTWEGGALMGVANLLAVVLTHDSGRLNKSDGYRIAGLTLLLGVLYLATRDLRGYATTPDAVADAGSADGHAHRLLAWVEPLLQHPHAALAMLVPSAFGLASIPFVVSFRRRWLAAFGLSLALAAAALHVFVAAGGVLVLMLLAGLIERGELFSVRARWYWAAVTGFLVLWLILDHWRPDFVTRIPGGLSSESSTVAALRDLFGFPDVYGAIVRPWARTIPVLFVSIGAALLYWFWRILSQRDHNRPQSALLCLVIAMSMSVALISTSRIETRYTFFLYPACLALLVAAILDALGRIPVRPLPVALSAMVPLLCFGATEDFQPRHLAHIDSAQVNFRVGMSPARVAHYYPRNDMRQVGRWLASNAGPGDLVVTGIPNLDAYFDRSDYFFFDTGDERYDSYVCADGAHERWSNRAVLYGRDQLAALVDSGRKVYLVVYPEVGNDLEAAGAANAWSVRRVWASDHDQSDVLLLAAGDEREPTKRR